MLRYSIILFVFVLFFSCEQRSKNIASGYPSIFSPTGNYTELKLDSLTGFWHLSFRIDTYNSSQECISFINTQTNSLYIYSATSGDLITVKKINVEGANGVGNLSVAGHLVHNLDSIYIYNPNQGKLYLIDSESEVVNKYQIMKYDDDVPIMPEPNGLSRIVKIKDELYFPSIFKRRLNVYDIPSVVIFSLSSGVVKTKFPYPKKYSEAHWGSTFKYLPSIAHKEGTEVVLVSYPIMDNIVSYDVLLGSMKELAMSSDLIDEFKPYSYDLADAFNNTNDYFDRLNIHSFSNSDYTGILYDKYRQLFYRVSYIRPDEKAVRKGDMGAEFISITAFNESYEKVAEEKFDADKYNASMIVVTKDGLLMPRIDLYDKNEDVLQLERVLVK